MRRLRGWLVVVAAAAVLGPDAAPVHGQFTDPCEVACGITLGASSFVFATGLTTAVGRLRGGFSTVGQAAVTWSAGFAVSAGAGIALHDDGSRQRRAVYGSALGAAGGALVGLAAESLVGESTSATRLAGALIGAAVGVAAGGIVGAASYDGPDEATPTFTVVGPTLTIPLGR